MVTGQISLNNLDAYKSSYSYVEGRSGYRPQWEDPIKPSQEAISPYRYEKISTSIKKNFGATSASLLALLIRWQNTNGKVTQTQKVIANQLGCSTSAIEKSVRAFKKAGLLQVNQRMGSNRTNSYVINHAALNLFHAREGALLSFKEPPQKQPDPPETGSFPHAVKSTTCSYIDNTINRFMNSEANPKEKKDQDLHIKVIQERLKAFLGKNITLDRRLAQLLGGIRKKKLKEKCGAVTAESQLIVLDNTLEKMALDVGGVPMLEYILNFNSWDKVLGKGEKTITDYKAYKPPEKADEQSVEAEVLEQITNSDTSPETKQAQREVLAKVGALAYKSWFTQWRKGKIMFKSRFALDTAYARYHNEIQDYTDWEILE